MLGKTQHEIENEYAWIDLPQLLDLSGEQRARELLEMLEVSSFPHLSDAKVKEAILKRYRERLPKPASVPPKSAQEQYEALRARMIGR